MYIFLITSLIWIEVLASVISNISEKNGGKFMTNKFFDKLFCNIKAIFTSMIATLVLPRA